MILQVFLWLLFYRNPPPLSEFGTDNVSKLTRRDILFFLISFVFLLQKEKFLCYCNYVDELRKTKYLDILVVYYVGIKFHTTKDFSTFGIGKLARVA